MLSFFSYDSLLNFQHLLFCPCRVAHDSTLHFSRENGAVRTEPTHTFGIFSAHPGAFVPACLVSYLYVANVSTSTPTHLTFLCLFPFPHWLPVINLSSLLNCPCQNTFSYGSTSLKIKQNKLLFDSIPFLVTPAFFWKLLQQMSSIIDCITQFLSL